MPPLTLIVGDPLLMTPVIGNVVCVPLKFVDIDIILLPFNRTTCAANVNVVFQAQVIILDSPLSMLDPKGRRQVWGILKKYRPGRTILLTTQYMDEAEHLGNRIAVMANGKLMCWGTSMFLKQIIGKGLCKVKKIRHNWVGGSWSHSDFFLENRFKIVLYSTDIFWIVYHVYYLCTWGVSK